MAATGEPCAAHVMHGMDYCYHHNPAMRDHRSNRQVHVRHSAKVPKDPASGTVALDAIPRNRKELAAMLCDTMSRLRQGTLTHGQAAAAVALAKELQKLLPEDKPRRVEDMTEAELRKVARAKPAKVN